MKELEAVNIFEMYFLSNQVALYNLVFLIKNVFKAEIPPDEAAKWTSIHYR